MKRRVLIALAVLAVAAATVVLVSQTNRKPIQAYYIINNPCESCREYEGFLERFQASLGAQASLCPVTKVNLLTDEGRQTFSDLCQRFGIPRQDRIAPMLIIGGRYLVGMDNIRQNGPALYEALRQGRPWVTGSGTETTALASAVALQPSAAAEAGDSYLLYFTTELCAACKQSSAWLAKLPPQAEVTTAQGTVQSKIVLRTYSTTKPDNMDLLTQLYEKWKVPADQRTVPVIFYQSGYLRGADAIESGLLQEIANGRALGYDGAR